MITQAVIASFIAGLSTIVGVQLVRRWPDWTRRNALAVLSFAVGVILAASFFELLPEAQALTASWPYWVLGAILALYLIEHIITIHGNREHYQPEFHSVGIVSVLGIGIHSLVDGIVIGVGFEVSLTLGLIASVAVIAHELAEGVFSYTLLIHDQVAESRATFYSWLVALATPVGTLLTVLVTRDVPASVLGVLLAIAAGSFIYVGGSDLVPETHRKQPKLANIALVLAGVAFVLLISKLTG